MKDFNIFRDYVLNQKVEISDATNIYQCFDLAYAFTLFLHVPKASIQHLNAYEIYTKPNDLTKTYFDIIPNTSDFIPAVGDIEVFDTTVGPAGHVCICIGEGNKDTFQSLDANWAGRSAATLTTHNYNGFLGVLRFKPQPVLPTITNQTQIPQIENLQVDQIKSAYYDRAKAINDLQNQILTLNRRIDELMTQLNAPHPPIYPPVVVEVPDTPTTPSANSENSNTIDLTTIPNWLRIVLRLFARRNA